MTTIFDSIQIKNIKIQNRIVLPPLVRFSIIEKDGFVNDKLVEWYETIAKNGVGLIIVEASSVSENGKLRDNQLGIWDNKFIPGLKKIADKVHEYNTKIMIQVHHAGFKEKITDVSTEELDIILEDFKAAFKIAKTASFDGIEIHGAHTYLLSQLASHLWNSRTDKYGGDFNGRMHFAERLITETREIFNKNFILGYRMGGNEPELIDGIKIAKFLENLGIDILHVSSGIPNPEYKKEKKVDVPQDFPLDWVVYMATEIKKHVKIPVIAVRKIKKESQASWLIENNYVDMVAIGRAMLSNPDWIGYAKKLFLKRKENEKKENEKKEEKKCNGVARNAHENKENNELINIDIFCKIVDNYGDIGVVLRLGKELKKTLENKINLRIIISKIDELIAINPKIKDLDYQEFNNITYITNSYFEKNIKKLGVANLVIETFGCGIPDYYMELAYFNSEYILNLEYLTGEKWVNDFHMKESLLPKGSVKKYFYFPGFSEEAGGLVIREQIRKKVNAHKEKYLKKYYGEFLNPEKKLKGTIFSYEKNFIPFFDALKKLDEEVILMIFSTKTQNSIKNIFNKKIFGNAYKYGKIEMKFSKFLSQDQYEEIINVSDFNFVRGEDSATMAVTSGKPFLWQLYPQENNTHMEKLEGFLDTYTTFLNKNNKNIDDKNLTANLIKLFKDYNDKVDNYLDLGNESYLYFLKNIKNIERANIVFADYLLSKCNLINKLKSFIYEFLGGKK